MTRLGDLEDDQLSFKKITKTVEMHNDAIMRIIQENDGLKKFVREHFTKAEGLLSKNSEQMEEKFEFIFKSELKDLSTKDYVQDRLCDKANAADMVRLNREFRMLETYVSKLEKVVFQGYKKEAEVYLQAKLDKEEFKKYQDSKNKEFKTNSKSLNTIHGAVHRLNQQFDGLDDDLRYLKERFEQAEANKEVKVVYPDIDDEDTIDFSKVDYDSITKVPIPHIAKRILKPMYREIENLKQDITDNISNLLKEKDVQQNFKLDNLAKEYFKSQAQINTCMDKIDDLIAEKIAAEQQSQKLAENLEHLHEKLKGQERRSLVSIDEIHKKLSEHDINLQGIHQQIDYIKISKEKLFDEVCRNLDDLICSKFSLSTKLENSDFKLSQMLTDLTERQTLLQGQIDNAKKNYEVTISHLQNETDAYSQELKRMQIFNRELVEKFNTLDSNRNIDCRSSIGFKESRKNTFVTEDASSMNNIPRSYSRPKAFSRIKERPVNSACQTKRRTNSDHKSQKRPMTTNKFKKTHSRIKFTSELKNSERSNSRKCGNRSIDNKTSLEIPVNKMFAKSKGIFQKFETILMNHPQKLNEGPKTTSGRHRGKKGNSTSKSGTTSTNFIENFTMHSKKNSQICSDLDQNLRSEILEKYRNRQNQDQSKKFSNTMHRIQHLIQK
ncbi:unnamed protein product [Moneuplotes crassus]|uniref:Uncharacterized protein n=1 Tax=Euplotes crassus TaxID=5936 RepID=A0AAD1Y5E4_EUPCR|nr:unnamed protein product [Moneuplotes crassus]